MKLTVLIMCLAMVSAVVWARDLSSAARKERARRQAIHARGESAETFTNADLETYPGEDAPPSRRQRSSAYESSERDLAKEESFWRGETVRHNRELARIDANIRRLEWRLRERRVKMKSKGRLRDDPSLSLIEESLESLREERERVKIEFLERARKAGAFPGWLR